MPKTIIPEALSKNYTCPFCDITAPHNWDVPFGLFHVTGKSLSQGPYIPNLNSPADLQDDKELRHWVFSECTNCGKLSIWRDGKMVYPTTLSVEDPDESMPQETAEVYREAASIFPTSPRAAAALLRLALQMLLKYILGSSPKKTIQDDILTLRAKGLPDQIVKALDCIRISGNESVHPGTINLDEAPDDALFLFTLMNMLCSYFIAQPKQLKELYDRLPESKKIIRD